MSVTMKQLAAIAGVTATTISLVLKDSPKVGQKTKDRIKKLMDKMDYYPDISGRNLKQGKTNTIAVLSSFFHGIFKMEFVNGVESVIINTPYRLNQFYTKTSGQEGKYKEILYGKLADAVISLSLNPEPAFLRKMNASQKHIVLVEDTAIGFPGVMFDNFTGAYTATEYLIKNGRKKIAFSIADLKLFGMHHNTRERVRGYKKALKDYGMEFNKNLFVEIERYDMETGRQIYTRLKSNRAKYDAVFCASGDLTAAGFLKEAFINKTKVPEDVAVIGYDDSIIASATSPGLTTIRQPAFQMGQAACQLAISLIEQKNVDNNRIITFNPELIKRESA
jgi:DNA-binding LacI/PurR family transcriptional regulator